MPFDELFELPPELSEGTDASSVLKTCKSSPFEYTAFVDEAGWMSNASVDPILHLQGRDCVKMHGSFCPE